MPLAANVPEPAMTLTVVRPVTGYEITQVWGQLEGEPRGTVNPGGVDGHPGTDYGCPDGTTVLACADGVVIYEGNAAGFGDNLVSIWHPQFGVTSRYGHMESHLVVQGQPVTAGLPVGLSDNEGASTGPHLHFEIGTTQAIDAGNPPNIDSEAWLLAHLTSDIPTIPEGWLDMAAMSPDDLSALIDLRLKTVVPGLVTGELNKGTAVGQPSWAHTNQAIMGQENANAQTLKSVAGALVAIKGILTAISTKLGVK